MPTITSLEFDPQEFCIMAAFSDGLALSRFADNDEMLFLPSDPTGLATKDTDIAPYSAALDAALDIDRSQTREYQFARLIRLPIGPQE